MKIYTQRSSWALGVLLALLLAAIGITTYSVTVPHSRADATTTQATSTSNLLTGTVTAATSTSIGITGMLNGTVVATSTSTPPSTLSSLILQLQGLESTYPQFASALQAFIMQLQGNSSTTTSTGTNNPTGALVEQNGWTVKVGDTIDFGGRNFGHEEQVTVVLNGQLVTKAHADGGGNFSTGTLSLPTIPGTYTYVFTGQNSGDMIQTVVHVQ